MIQDVLVFTPVLRLEPETVQAVLALEWDGPLSFLWQRDNPRPNQAQPAGPWREKATYDDILNHLHQYQRARQMFLKGSYEALLVIESDIIPPPDTLQRLAALDADVAYGCYLYRQYRQEPDINVQTCLDDGQFTIRTPLTAIGQWEIALGESVIDCAGAGLGCVLIQRPVLEAVDFRASTLPTTQMFCDVWFTQDVFEGHYTMRADTRVLCGHKRPDGVVMWPNGAADA